MPAGKPRPGAPEAGASKFVGRARLKALLAGLKKRGRTVVFANGCFDLLHVGHLRYLAGAKRAGGKQSALYEPIHGSAPDIAGKGLANPIASILSLVMAFRYSFARADFAELVDKAVDRVLAEGFRTGDIMQPGMNKVGTAGMTDAILKALDKVSAG